MQHLPVRKIIHIDMDAFYASVEQRDHPDYRGKPIVVGGLLEGRGGVVATASYEARKFGIHSAMPSKRAVQLCPHAIFIRPRFDVYKQVSKQIREIFHRYTDLVEPLSLDEAYLDVTFDKQGIGSALDIARKIKQAIRDELGLTASAGVSINKFVAKIASDLQKPDGLTFIGPSRIQMFMEQLPVEKFFGVGKVTAQKMKNMGLHTGLDIKALMEHELVQHFGKSGHFYYAIVRGIDNRTVEPNRETKSIGAEDTFPHDLTELPDMFAELDKIALVVEKRLERYGFRAKTLTLKIKYSDFRQITRSFSYPQPVEHFDIAEKAKWLLEATAPQGNKIRLLGITLSNFSQSAVPPGNTDAQLPLFPQP
ncbi:DNA polymerase IV [Segetibacter sp. 3557_3]|uniref:DNA polymerase IV n=1 Tax=Segetibacter sp. 3557_3 TaxID=2547429 RepID=UPI001058A525|nr:DNA polymerase IV [Segetibacter sp. 3557_3]TDH18421.1 DNA polymerase IV [Segetibacter sp. 3557_3]